MKERNRKGKFRAAETVAYKMTQHHGFDQVSWQAFQEAAAEKYDFATCQRADGSYYGTGGQCRKGTPATLPDRKGKKKEGGGGDSGSAGSVAKSLSGELAEELDLSKSKAAALQKSLEAAAGKAQGGNTGGAIVDIDKALDKAGADMDQRERVMDEIGATTKPITVTKDLKITNLELKDSWEQMDSDTRSEIKEAAREFKKGNIDSQDARNQIESALDDAGSIGIPRMGKLKGDDAFEDYEIEILEQHTSRWHDAVFNSVDSGANSLMAANESFGFLYD